MSEPIESLEPDPQNPREIAPEALAGLGTSMGEYGDLSGIVVNGRTGILIAGHQRVRSLQEAGATQWERDGEGGYIEHPRTGERFPIRIVDWDAQKARAANLAANNEQIQGDFTKLALDQLQELHDADMPAFEDLRLDAMMEALEAELGETPTRTTGDPDELPDPSGEHVTRSGDLWVLGKHRLICGDTFQDETITRLLEGVEAVDLFLTDPPYGIYGSSTGIGADISDDKMVRPFFENVFRLAFRLLRRFGHAYICCDWRSWAAIWESAKRQKMTAKNLLVWDKGGSGLGSNYANTYELIGFFSKLPPETAMKSTTQKGQRMVHSPNVLRFDRPSGLERLHNAAKPVAMLEELIKNSSDAGAVVLDPFSGSGSAMIAAERQDRRCFAVEIEPATAEVAVRRWERATGQQAILHRPPAL
jgi:DNA modification methylase